MLNPLQATPLLSKWKKALEDTQVLLGKMETKVLVSLSLKQSVEDILKKHAKKKPTNAQPGAYFATTSFSGPFGTSSSFAFGSTYSDFGGGGFNSTSLGNHIATCYDYQAKAPVKQLTCTIIVSDANSLDRLEDFLHFVDLYYN